MASEQEQQLFQQLNLETAKIQWQELERFFAAGQLIAVDKSLDLVHVAAQIAQDNKVLVEELMQSGKLAAVSDGQATQWQSVNQELWAVVIKPWILVQA